MAQKITVNVKLICINPNEIMLVRTSRGGAQQDVKPGEIFECEYETARDLLRMYPKYFDVAENVGSETIEELEAAAVEIVKIEEKRQVARKKAQAKAIEKQKKAAAKMKKGEKVEGLAAIKAGRKEIRKETAKAKKEGAKAAAVDLPGEKKKAEPKKTQAKKEKKEEAVITVDEIIVMIENTDTVEGLAEFDETNDDLKEAIDKRREELEDAADEQNRNNGDNGAQGEGGDHTPQAGA